MEQEPRETAGTTICLVVRYVRAHAGDDGVARLLQLAGETRTIEELEDEHRWSTYRQKIALFDAACIVLDDPDALLHEQLEHRAVHDPLTGLANRALAAEELDKATARAERDHLPLSVLFVDLDDFKSINDRFGHGAGDYTLRVVAARLIDAARRGDAIARLGGDEFVMILPGATEPDAAMIADRVRTAISAPIELGDVVVEMHASVGASTAPEDGTEPQMLLRAADLAMYRIKATERLSLAVTPA